ncbi:MAG TPA: hypothetical protein VK922_09610 [Gemmatimonadaceae bacterium]|nr:hypothetical protein [Gemmatimonadaceae bacterium]
MRTLAGRWGIVLVMVAPLAACEGERAATPIDSVVSEPTLPPDTAAVPVAPTSAWLRSSGPVLAVPGPNPGDAHIVFPELTDTTLTDTVRFAPSRADGLVLELFDRSGLVAQDTVARMAAHEWTEGCIDWPAAALRGAPLRWTVGFAAGRVAPIPLDSIEAMPASDSSALAVTLARLASTLPDSAGSRFQGLPFRVRTAYRMPLEGGGRAVIADLVRRLTVEASPLEEHTLMIAEHDSAGAPLRMVYHDRRAGTEEVLEAMELLAAVRIGADAHAALVLVHVGYETTAYTLLERLRPGQWRTRWRSVTTGC